MAGNTLAYAHFHLATIIEGDQVPEICMALSRKEFTLAAGAAYDTLVAMNEAIRNGQAFCGADRIPRVIGVSPSKQEMQSLSDVVSDATSGLATLEICPSL